MYFIYFLLVSDYALVYIVHCTMFDFTMDLCHLGLLIWADSCSSLIFKIKRDNTFDPFAT